MKELWWTVRFVTAGTTAPRPSRRAHRSAGARAGGGGHPARDTRMHGRPRVTAPPERTVPGRTVTAHLATRAHVATRVHESTRALPLDRAPGEYGLSEGASDGRVRVAVRPGLPGAA